MVFASDFETGVYAGQERTWVWSAASVDLYDSADEVIHHTSIDEFMSFVEALFEDSIFYFHNLKFDVSFILNYLLKDKRWKQALDEEDRFISPKKMKKRSYSYMMTAKGQFYQLTMKLKNGVLVRFYDSLKLLPFPLSKVGEAFHTNHRKLNMAYEGYRPPGYHPTEEELNYIDNDVLVLKEALLEMFKRGHDKLTIGGCCMREFKEITGKEAYKERFPRLDKIKTPIGCTEDEYVRKAYRGAWTHLVKGKENMTFRNGKTLDVNSLYPFVMHSPYRYPVGKGTFFTSDKFEKIHKWYKEKGEGSVYYFVTIRTRFRLKDGYLPFIQIKNDLRYMPRAMLETNEVTVGGKTYDPPVTMTVTCTDLVLMMEHYELFDLEVLHGFCYETETGIFDGYIDKYKEIKENSEGVERTIAKLFSNNLYGKLATSPESSYKIAYLSEDGVIKWRNVIDSSKKTVHIACGAAVTSYARDYIIRIAQMNYYGSSQQGFIYADTDSLHIDLPDELIRGVKLHDTRYGAFKREAKWSEGRFIRSKSYVERHDDGEIYVTCCGMPKKVKDKWVEKVIKGKADFDDFAIGLEMDGKLLFKQIKGGAVLEETSFKMLPQKWKARIPDDMKEGRS